MSPKARMLLQSISNKEGGYYNNDMLAEISVSSEQRGEREPPRIQRTLLIQNL